MHSSAAPSAQPLPATHSAPVLGRAWLAAIALLVVTLVAYGPSLWRAQFLNFDDNFYFGPDNAVFRAASAAAEEHGLLAGLGVVLDPSAIVADVWLPVAHASLWIDAWWGGGTPFLPHLHAALLHALAAILLLLTLALPSPSSPLSPLALFTSALPSPSPSPLPADLDPPPKAEKPMKVWNSCEFPKAIRWPPVGVL